MTVRHAAAIGPMTDDIGVRPGVWGRTQLPALQAYSTFIPGPFATFAHRFMSSARKAVN